MNNTSGVTKLNLESTGYAGKLIVDDIPQTMADKIEEARKVADSIKIAVEVARCNLIGNTPALSGEAKVGAVASLDSNLASLIQDLREIYCIVEEIQQKLGTVN